MTLEIVVELQRSCETVKSASVRKITYDVYCCLEESCQPSSHVLIKTHPDIEVDFLNDTAAFVQVQAQLVETQSFLQKVTEVVL